MNIFGFNIQRRELSDVPTQDCGKNAGNAVGANYTAEPVHIRGEQGALTVSPWYRAMEVLANTVGQSVMEFQRLIPGCHVPTYEKYMYGMGGRLNYLLGVQPNEMMNAMDFWKQMTIQRFNNGNGIAFIERDGIEVVAIWLCSAASYDYLNNQYIVSYNRPGVGVVSLIADPNDIIHWRNTFSYDGGITGVGTLRYAINTLSTAATNEKQAQEIAAKGGKFKILLSEDQSNTDSMFNLLSSEQRETARKQLQDQIAGNYDVMEVNGLVKAQIISQDANQMNLLQSRIQDSTFVSQFTGVPLPLLMINANNTYKAPEQLAQQYYTHTASPMLRGAELATMKPLVSKEQYPVFRCHFNTSELMRLDPKLQMEVIKAKIESGIYCIDEARADLGMAPLGEKKGGEQHLVSTNLQKLDDIKIGKNQVEPKAETQKSKDEEKEDEE